MAERASVVVLGLFLFQFVALGCLIYIVIDTRNELAAFKDTSPRSAFRDDSTAKMKRQAESGGTGKLEEALTALLGDSGTEEQRISLASLLLQNAIEHIFTKNTEAVFNCSYNGIDKTNVVQ